jgi:multicomponent Na+:H+ antiporter subunit B
LIYWGTGFASLLLGKAFLNYSALTVFGSEAQAHSMGILLVEIGVGLAVMALLVSIYDDLLIGEPKEELK